MGTFELSPLPYSGQVPLRGKVLSSFGLLGWRWISRNPAMAIAPVLIPFMFLYFLRIITPASAFPAEVVGAMLFVSQNIGNWVLGDSATWRIQNSIQDLFVASPLGKVRYLVGIGFSNIIAALPAMVILGVMLALIYPVPVVGWFILLGSMAVLWMLFSAIGIMISSRIKSRREVWPVGSLAFTALGMLSPLYYPLSTLPTGMQYVALCLPGTYAAMLAKGGMGMISIGLGSMVEYFLMLLLSATTLIAISLHFYRWRLN
jgi:ABC-2 type transport system permease protein